MTIEEKARMIEKYCDSITDCSECAIKDNAFTCYGKYDEFPEEIEKNYEIIFGNSEDTDEEKKSKDDEEKMTIGEKAKKIKEYCESSYCSSCAIRNECTADFIAKIHESAKNINNNSLSNAYDIEKNYDIIFGNKLDTKEEKAEDMVNHPSHYTSGGVECIDAITAALSKYDDPVDAWLVGQVIKYLWRAPLKGKYDEDIHKAQFYLNRLVEKINKNG